MVSTFAGIVHTNIEVPLRTGGEGRTMASDPHGGAGSSRWKDGRKGGGPPRTSGALAQGRRGPEDGGIDPRAPGGALGDFPRIEAFTRPVHGREGIDPLNSGMS